MGSSHASIHLLEGGFLFPSSDYLLPPFHFITCNLFIATLACSHNRLSISLSMLVFYSLPPNSSISSSFYIMQLIEFLNSPKAKRLCYASLWGLTPAFLLNIELLLNLLGCCRKHRTISRSIFLTENPLCTSLSSIVVWIHQPSCVCVCRHCTCLGLFANRKHEVQMHYFFSLF